MENKEIRKLNLRAVIDNYYDGVDRRLALAMGKQANEISRIFTSNQNSKRNVSDHFAREVEKLISKPTGWMDTPHPALWNGSDLDLVTTMSDLADTLSTAEKAALVKILLDKITNSER